MPTWNILAPSDTKLPAKGLGAVYFKQIKPWLDYFNANTGGSLLRSIVAPLDTKLPVKDDNGNIKGHINVKDSKPWSDFFNSEDEGGVTTALGITTTSPLPAGLLTVAYTGIVTASGGVLPYAWSITAGALPSGLALDASTGAITGTPTATGVFTFTVEVTDAEGTMDSLAATMTVYEAPGIDTFTDAFTRGNGQVGTDYVALGKSTWAVFNNQLLYTTETGFSAGEGLVALVPAALRLKTSQYMAVNFVSASVANRVGGAVMLTGQCSGDAMYGYFFHCFGATINLLGIHPGVINYTVALGLGTAVLNDLFELQVDIGVTSNRVRLWQNGVLLADVADATVGRLTSPIGLPGFYGSGNVGAASTWDNFTCRESR